MNEAEKGMTFLPESFHRDELKLKNYGHDAILKIERPNDVAAVRRLVGLVNYLSKFLSKLSELCEPLRRLTHKDVEWSWSAVQEEAFQSIKHAVTSPPVLRYFNSAMEIEERKSLPERSYN